MPITVSAMVARQKFGEILNRVNLVHDQFIIERNGQALAAIVPISALEDLKNKARKRAISFLESSSSELSDEEAMTIAVEEVRAVRSSKKKTAKK